jgi:branched-chain amino acid transport system ATP-binding protein
MTAIEAGTVLEARSLTVGYGAMPVVHDLNIVVHKGEVVALLGVNGAGKTTTVRALAGDLKPFAGEVWLKGRRVTGPAHRRAKQGMRYISEERSVFMNLSASDNLRLGRGQRERCLELFPELEPLLGRKAALLSGGEQQILTLARALSARPEMLLADELSLGLAPLVLERLLLTVRAAADGGAAVLLVEQHVRDALEVADRAYVMSHGKIVLQGDAKDLKDRIGEIEGTYLAGAELGHAGT